MATRCTISNPDNPAGNQSQADYATVLLNVYCAFLCDDLRQFKRKKKKEIAFQTNVNRVLSWIWKQYQTESFKIIICQFSDQSFFKNGI